MQIALAARRNFTHPSPQQLMRASVFFTGCLAGGAAASLMGRIAAAGGGDVTGARRP